MVKLRDDILSVFDQTYAARTRVEFLKLTGVSEALLARLDRSVVDRLWITMGRLLMQAKARAYLYFGDRRHQMHDPGLGDSISRLLVCFVTSPDRSACRARLDQLGTTNELAREFMERYWDFRAAIDAQHITPPAAMTLALGIRALALNQPLDDLYRCELDNLIDAKVKEQSDLGCFIDTIVRYWASSLNYGLADKVNLQHWALCDAICIDGGMRFRLDGDVLPSEQLKEMLQSAVSSPKTFVASHLERLLACV